MSYKCNLESCRYNHNGICQNKEKREERVGVSRKVLCLENAGMTFTNITSTVKHIGKYAPEETIETSTIQDEPIIIANNEQDRRTLEEVYKQTYSKFAEGKQ